MATFPVDGLYPNSLLFPESTPTTYVDGAGLGVRIRIAFGATIGADPATWTWTDVTPWWHTPDDVSIGWGRSSGAEQPETSTLSLTLKNTDGRFTSMDPRSPYWPNVRKWTPIQYDIDLGDGQGWRNRFSGFIRKWPLTWPGASGLMALARIEAVGVLGRLARGKPPSRSPMRRTIGGTNPVAYWPAEDGVAAAQAGSATAGAAPLTVAGVVDFKPVADYVYNTTTTRYGTSALANLAAGGRLTASLPAAATAATAASGAWMVHVAFKTDPATSSGDVVLMEWTTPGGSYVRWRLVSLASVNMQVIAYDTAGNATVILDRGSARTTFDTFAVGARQFTGGNMQVALYTSSTGEPNVTLPGTLAGITSITVNPTGATATVDMPAGHLAVWDDDFQPFQMGAYLDSYGAIVWDALRSHLGEAAHLRLARLAAEDGIPLAAIPTVPAEAVTRMGWQQPGTPLDLYQETENADQGLIYETGWGLGYLPRYARYSPTVALTIDGDAGQLGMPFEPVDDDQMLRNSWTVERQEGASATAADQQSINVQGEIEASVTVNLASDLPLAAHASWRLRLSTVQEPRYPALSIQLNTSPELAAAWCDCRPGSRVQVVNPPPQNPQGVVDQVVVGAGETYRGRTSWKATLNVVPASPWQVATADDGQQRAAADGTTLASALGLPPAPLNSNPYVETDASGWFGQGATVARTTAQAHQGVASLLLTPNGVAAQAVAGSGTGPVTAGSTYRASAWVRCSTTRAVHLGINWFDASNAYMDTSSQAEVTVQADTWTLLTFTATAPAGAAYGSVNAVLGGTPPTSHLLYIDEATLTPAVTVQITSTAVNGRWSTDPADYPQDLLIGGERVTATGVTGTGLTQTVDLSARGLNGFTRAWPAGTQVDVWQPAISPL